MARSGKELARECYKISIRFVALARQQELHAEITKEISLIITRWFKAAAGHDEKNEGRTDLVAATEVYRGLYFRRAERSLAIELDVSFKLRSEIVPDDQAGEPGVWTFVDERITEFVIHVDRPKFLGEFDRQKESIARRRDPAVDGIVGIVNEELREDRNVETGLSRIVEAPFDTGIGLADTEFSWGSGVVDA